MIEVRSLEQLVAQLEEDRSLLERDHVHERLDALDRIDACFPHLASAVSDSESSESQLSRRASALRERLEAANRDFYFAIRRDIQSGLRPDAFMRYLQPPLDRCDPRGLGYDALDELIGGVLQLDEPAAGHISREPEKVFYQPTPARHIFSLMGLAELGTDDVLIDMGSGLGHVPVLVSICTHARCIGVEVEPVYVECARQCAKRLNLNRVEFVRLDAREADLSAGTVFYLYTPFTGSILRAVLDRLAHEAATRGIRVCSYGPCTKAISKEPWLTAETATYPDRVALFRSRD